MTVTLTNLTTPGTARLLIFPPSTQASLITFDPVERSFNAWARGGAECTVILNKTGGSNEDVYDTFVDTFCDGCRYFFDTDEKSDTDSNGNTREVTIYSACSAHRDGIRSQLHSSEEGCLRNFNIDDIDASEESCTTTLPDLLYSYEIKSESTAIGATRFEWSEEHGLHATDCSGMLNVGMVMQPACWGHEAEEPLFGAVITAFAKSVFNEDLMNIDEFHAMKKRLDHLDLYYVDELFLRKPGDNIDGVITSVDTQARLQLLASGIDINQSPHGFIPLMRHLHEEVNGFITPPIPAISSRCWFFTVDGFLLGQVPTPTPQTSASAPCPTT